MTAVAVWFIDEPGFPVPKLAPKAIFALFTLKKVENRPVGPDRVILIFSTVVTVGLVALCAFGKITSRW